jgi:hypothetical protein
MPNVEKAVVAKRFEKYDVEFIELPPCREIVGTINITAHEPCTREFFTKGEKLSEPGSESMLKRT